MVKYNLSQITDEMSRANKVISSGKRITELSDDPVGLVQSLHIRSALSGLEQTGRNISLGESWLSAAESSLTEVQTILSNAKALCVQMASGTTGPGQRASAALTVQNMLEEVISLANTEVAGRYIFSGSRTEEAPFEQDGTYRGNNISFSNHLKLPHNIQKFFFKPLHKTSSTKLPLICKFINRFCFT